MQSVPTVREYEKPRVLVVDDDDGPRESIALILSNYYEVRKASSGDEALGILAGEPLDVITLDLRMPGLSGEETLGRIRRIDPDIEVVIITGHGSYDSAVEVLRLRAFDYLSKPFRTDQLLDVVGRAAESRRRKTSDLDLGDVLPPLGEIMDEVERLSRSSSDLPDFDRAAFDRIVGRLHRFRSRLHNHFGPRSSTSPSPRKEVGA